MGISSLIGPAIGLGTSLFGGGGGGSASKAYVPQWQGGADTSLQNLFQGYQNPYGAISGYNTNYLQGTQNNPYAGLYQGASNNAGQQASTLGNQQTYAGGNLQDTGFSGNNAAQGILGQLYNPYMDQMFQGAGAAGNAYTTTGTNALSAAGSLPGTAQSSLGGLAGLAQGYSDPLQSYASSQAGYLPGLAQGLTSGIMPTANQTGNTLLGAGNQVLQSAFDPQNQLYSRSFQQNQDQTRASLAARGLNSSGVGAGIENQSNMDFNTNWQNQQLGRQQAGLSSYGSAAGQALGGLESGSAATYNPIASGYGQGLGALNTSATTGYGLQSGAAGQYLSGLTNSYGAANALGTSGAQNLMTGGSALYDARTNNVNNYINQLGQVGNAAGTYGNLSNQGQQMAQGGIQNTIAGGQLPYQSYGNILSGNYGGLSNYLGLAGQGQGFDNSQITNLLSYLGAGQVGQGQAYGQNQQNQQNIGSLLGGLYGGYQNNTGLGGQLGSTFGGYGPSTSGANAVFNPVMTFS